jgi:hypothetical protein
MTPRKKIEPKSEVVEDPIDDYEAERQSRAERISVLGNAASSLIDEVSRLRRDLVEEKEANAKRRSTDIIRASVVVFVIMVMLGGNFITNINARHAAIEAKRSADSNGRSLEILESATLPSGKIYKQGQKNTACAVQVLIDSISQEIREAHHLPPREPGAKALGC